MGREDRFDDSIVGYLMSGIVRKQGPGGNHEPIRTRNSLQTA